MEPLDIIILMSLLTAFRVLVPGVSGVRTHFLMKALIAARAASRLRISRMAKRSSLRTQARFFWRCLSQARLTCHTQRKTFVPFRPLRETIKYIYINYR
jgi:hypothetical protein